MENPTDQVWQPREFKDIPTEMLAASGLRLTLTRLYLYDLFEQYHHTSLSCDEIFRLLIRAGIPVKASSIYANVREFSRLGLLVKGAPRERVRVSATYRLSLNSSQDCVRALTRRKALA